jgi:hypothetical protein
LKDDDFAVVLDYIFFILNFLAVLFLFYFIVGSLEPYGSVPASINLSVSVNGGNTEWSIDLFPLLLIATIFFLSQVYLNYRLLRKDSQETHTEVMVKKENPKR